MIVRTFALIVAALDAAALAMAEFALFASGADPATRGLDNAAGAAVALLFALTVLPALALIVSRRAPRAALLLALAFPGFFAAMFLATTIAYL